MPQVDFYILHTQQRSEKDRLACQLADKAWHQGYRIFIQTNFPAQAQHLDMMLWFFKEESFLPHDLYPDVPQSLAPIRIGYTAQICANMDVLINLTETVPPFYEHLKRIVEIVDDIPSARTTGRNRYRFYRDKGYELKTHQINR